jgi:hypothetical protein
MSKVYASKRRVIPLYIVLFGNPKMPHEAY